VTNEEFATTENVIPEDDDLGEIVKPTSHKKLNVVVSVRFSPDELKAIREVIGDDSLSTYVRTTVLKAANKSSIWWPERLPQSSSNSDVAQFKSTNDAYEPEASRIVTNSATAAIPRINLAS
jgi:hypothetical protein